MKQKQPHRPTLLWIDGPDKTTGFLISYNSLPCVRLWPSVVVSYGRHLES